MRQHTHKFKKVMYGGRKVAIIDGVKCLTTKGAYFVFKCMIPGCPTFKSAAIMEGAKSICWKCGQELVMTKAHLRSTFPVHEECKRSKVA